MNRRLLAAIAAAIVALAAVWYFGLRKRGTAKPTTTAQTVAAGSAAGSALRDRRPDGPDGAMRDRGEQVVLIDDDPVGPLRLEGLVLGPDDKPVAGATVVVSSNPSRTATTDTDGGFAFDKLVGRPYTLVARAPGGVGGPVTAKLTATSDPVTLRLRPAGSVKVTVVDKAGKPVPNATVELRGLDQQTAGADAAGVASFPVVVSGGYEVVAQAPGHAPNRVFSVVAAVPVELTLALVAGAAVTGTVIDERGQPVRQARVIYSGASEWSVQGDERRDAALTGAHGEFAFPALPAGSFRFIARHEAFAPGTSAIATLDGSNPTTGIEIKLTGGATVSGAVVDATGQAIGGARIRIGVASRGMIGSEPRQVYTDDDGTFEVRGLPRKPLEAVALAEAGASANVPVDTTAGDVKGVKLTIDQTGTIAGIVVDKNGAPLEGVQVSAMPDFRKTTAADPMQFRLRGMPQELTSAAGAFEIVGLAPGSYVVRAMRNASSRGRMFGIEGQKAETGTRNLRIVLPSDGGVKGKVAFADGTTPSTFMVGVGFSSEPVMSKDGKFELRDLPPQKYQLTVRGPDFDQKSLEVTVEEGEITDAGDLIVAKGRAIAGRVVGKDGAPIVGATVYAGQQIFGTGTSNVAQMGGGPPGRGGNREATTDDDGHFRIGGLGPTPLAVVAEHPDFGRSPAFRIIRGAGDETNLQLVLAGYGVLTGTVRDESGPAENTIVSAQSVVTPNALYSVGSGPDGTFRFDKLAPDVYKVSAMLGNPMIGMKSYSKKVTVTAETPVRVDLAVELGPITLVARVTASNGTVTGGLSLRYSGTITASTVEELTLLAAQNENNSTLQAMMGNESRFTELRPGVHTVCVAVLPAEVGLQDGMAYFGRHSDQLPVRCKTVTLTAAPAEQRIDLAVELPPLLPD